MSVSRCCFDVRLALNAERRASSLFRNCHCRSKQTTESNSSRMPRREGSRKVAVTNITGSNKPRYINCNMAQCWVISNTLIFFSAGLQRPTHLFAWPPLDSHADNKRIRQRMRAAASKRGGESERARERELFIGGGWC